MVQNAIKITKTHSKLYVIRSERLNFRFSRIKISGGQNAIRAGRSCLALAARPRCALVLDFAKEIAPNLENVSSMEFFGLPTYR